MALRNPGRLAITNWRGLNTFSHVHELDPDMWFDANNVIVNSHGGAEVLRSPKAFGTAITGYDDNDSDSQAPTSDPSSDSSEHDSDVDTGPILSMAEWERATTNLLIVDRGGDTYSYDSAGSRSNLRSDQAGSPWTSVNVNKRLHRIDGTEFIQYIMAPSVEQYRNGIDAPLAAPTISYVADDSSDSISDDCTIDVSVQVSYAYKNSDTGHVGPPSGLSNVLPASAGDNTLRIPVVASTQPGVDKIVFFITLDGGSIPYLALECDTGDVYEVANTTGNVDIPLCAYDADTLTPETLYNQPPPVDATHMFEWKDRLILLRGQFVQYSGFESAYMGVPQESWPPLNQLAIPNKTDTAVSGIGTAVGALVFGKKDSYIISGYPSDKVSSPNNTLAVTEHMDQLKWNLGIYEDGKDTPALTPFGVIWLDQNKRLRNWSFKEFPIEIGVALREELDGMTGTMSGKWFQHGKNAGFYVLRSSAKILFIMVYQGENGQIQFGYGKSDLATDAIAVAKFTTDQFFFGEDDQVYKFLNPDLTGDGWEDGTTIFFKSKIGNKGNFSYWHSVSVEGELGANFKLLVNDQVVPLESDTDTDTSIYGIVDQEARRHTMECRFNLDDIERRSVDAVQIFMKNKKRVI
jgi:hypothetical protein